MVIFITTNSNNNRVNELLFNFKQYINFNDIPAASFNYYNTETPFNIKQTLYNALHQYDRESLFKIIDKHTIYSSSTLTEYTETELINRGINEIEILVTLDIHNFNYTGEFASCFNTLLSNFIAVFKDVKIVFLRDTESFLISTFIDSNLNNETNRPVHAPEIIKWKNNMIQKNSATSNCIIDREVPYLFLDNLFYKDTLIGILQLCRFLNTKPSYNLLTFKDRYPTDLNCITNLQDLKQQLSNTHLSTCLR